MREFSECVAAHDHAEKAIPILKWKHTKFDMLHISEIIYKNHKSKLCSYIDNVIFNVTFHRSRYFFNRYYIIF